MKIAIVTPQAIPLVLGGAENLWWGLQDHFNNETAHQCDIISVPSPENSFDALTKSYETFSKLDLSGYECVISGKYPAWMVRHPNHVCYMLHRLRGLYDTYNRAQYDETVLADPALKPVMDLIVCGPDPLSEHQVPELFARLKAVMEFDMPDAARAFPGPFSRAVIHFLDAVALSAERISRYGAISGTIAKRKDYFPDGVQVDVLFPPPHMDRYFCGGADYFFTSSRLDGPKRIDLIIKAMKWVETDLPLLIAGSGPEEEALKALAGDDPRIRFLGYVADDDMPGLYANARAVPFVPADEDYGLVTIEAMKSAKPVVTLHDSGGPSELITDEQTGFICPPDIDALASAMQRLASDPDLAARMGKQALETSKAINWGGVTDGLMDRPQGAVPARLGMRPKLTVATVFKVFPPMNGGQARVFHLYRNMARYFDIDVVTLGEVEDSYSEREVAPGLMVIVVPKSPDYAEKEAELIRLAGYLPVNDIIANALLRLTPQYREALALSASGSLAIVACHPYMIETIKMAAPHIPVWYEAQDVELNLKTNILAGTPDAQELLAEVKAAERECWMSSERVFACARRDLEEFERLYGPTRAFLHEVPNGVALDCIQFTDLSERRRLKQAAGLGEKQLAIFIGSWHGPNLEAVEDLLVLASSCPETRFFIMGSVCLPFEGRDRPDNVVMLGAVSMEERDLFFSIADVALNPMRSGSGTNLKMFDYMAAGIPVISTAFGARGLSMMPGEHYLLAEGEELPLVLARLGDMPSSDLAALVQDARVATQRLYSWQVIAEGFITELGYPLDGAW